MKWNENENENNNYFLSVVFFYHVRGELHKIFNMVMEGRGEM